MSSVSFNFADNVSGFAVAPGESTEGVLTLGLAAVVGCGRRVLVFRELRHDLATGATELGDLALENDGGDPPGAPAIRWSGGAPRGFLVTWVTGDASTALMARLVGERDFAGPAIDLTSSIPSAVAFPFGSAIGPSNAGGLRVWTYARGPEQGVYEIALGCGGL